MPVQSELDPFETDLAELAAGVLGRREEATVLDHLSSCPNCAAGFVKLASTDSLIALLLVRRASARRARRRDAIRGYARRAPMRSPSRVRSPSALR